MIFKENLDTKFNLPADKKVETNTDAFNTEHRFFIKNKPGNKLLVSSVPHASDPMTLSLGTGLPAPLPHCRDQPRSPARGGRRAPAGALGEPG